MGNNFNYEHINPLDKLALIDGQLHEQEVGHFIGWLNPPSFNSDEYAQWELDIAKVEHDILMLRLIRNGIEEELNA